MSDLRNRIDHQITRLTHLRDSLDAPGKRVKIQGLEARMSDAGFWANEEAAQAVVRDLKALKSATDPLDEAEKRLKEARELLDLAEEMNDAATLREVADEAEDLARLLDEIDFKTLFTGPNDGRNAYINIHAGAGGTESCDWAQMLMRMYNRWAERKGLVCALLDANPGEEAGIRRATLQVSGPWAYGHLRTEIGVHRLVRISPFDANQRRHTSFASVDVLPELDEVEVDIREEDLKVDTFRAGGAGGQHVNKTESAIRITHLPTGLVVQCQNERSQHKNRKMAMKLMAAKLYRMKEKEREDDLSKLYGEKGEIAFGNQIRSYVLQPYQLVKDHRTDQETSQTDKVLDGDIDEFIAAYLKMKRNITPKKKENS
ncbi:MAG: peptide chain release factor 2 [Planctomycetota bacterium]